MDKILHHKTLHHKTRLLNPILLKVEVDVDVPLLILDKTLQLIGMLIVLNLKEERISVILELVVVFGFLDNVKEILIKEEEVDYPEEQSLELLLELVYL